MEDAKRAIELKNGSAIGGRKIRVKLAMHRLPRDHRQQKADKGGTSAYKIASFSCLCILSLAVFLLLEILGTFSFLVSLSAVSLEETKGNNDAVDLPSGVMNPKKNPQAPSPQKENSGAPGLSCYFILTSPLLSFSWRFSGYL